MTPHDMSQTREGKARRLIELHNVGEYSTEEFADVGVQLLTVLPTVFRPDISLNGRFLARALPDWKQLFAGKSVLDMGCGTGILGLICAIHGADSVTFSDLNPMAADNAALNAENLHIGSTWDVVAGELFGALQGRRFDVIVFNPPGISGVPANLTEATVLSKDSMWEKFFDAFPQHLSEDGLLIMPTTSMHAAERNPRTYALARGMQVSRLVELVNDDDITQYVVAIKTGESHPTSISAVDR